MQILVFLGLSVLELGPMYARNRPTDKQTDSHCHTASFLNAAACGAGHNNSAATHSKTWTAADLSDFCHHSKYALQSLRCRYLL